MKALASFALFAAAACFCLDAAYAEWRAPLPEVLKTLPQAATTCRREDMERAPTSRPDGQKPKNDFACSIGVSDLLQLASKGDVTMVDVRPSEARAVSFIEGSVSMTSAELRTKPYLRSQTVVLVGDGRNQRELFESCARLRADGFARSRVLNGGISAWSAHGRPTAGRAPSDAGVPRLDSGGLWAEAHFDANLVIVSEDFRRVVDQLPNAQVVATVDEGSLQRLVAQRLRGKRPLASVILASGTDWTNESLNRLRDALSPTPMLAYVGTQEAFARDMQRQKALWAAHARGPKQPSCGG